MKDDDTTEELVACDGKATQRNIDIRNVALNVVLMLSSITVFSITAFATGLYKTNATTIAIINESNFIKLPVSPFLYPKNMNSKTTAIIIKSTIIPILSPPFIT